MYKNKKKYLVNSYQNLNLEKNKLKQNSLKEKTTKTCLVIAKNNKKINKINK